jgi:hypothetical protein
MAEGEGGGSGGPPESTKGTTILILGILGLFCFICGIIAFVMGNKERKEIAEGRVAPDPKVTVGWVLGLISIILFVIGLAINILTMVAAS